MMKRLNITKLVTVSFLAVSIAAGTALAADPGTGVTCGAYETRGQYVSVSPFQDRSHDAEISQNKNMSASETAAIVMLSDNAKLGN